MAKIRVLVVNDHAVVLAGLRLLIEAESDLAVVAEVSNGDDAAEHARRVDPDVAVVDLTVPRTNGLQTIRQLRRLRPRIRILALTMPEDPAHGRVVLDEGADGYVTKRASAAELYTGIRTVHRGRRFVDGNTAETAKAQVTAAQQRGLRLLSERERQVLELLARGHSNREVADRLRVGVKTIETYRARLRSKLGLKTRAELVRYASTHGLL